ncbi:hypothetical protein SD71_21485 [Cohnella kolymensis]|uniref:ATP-grasp domain-containing protein n=1 Tax=Cohnella kolymensis TaxID=1590652 RepID=A0ABR4ZZM3_9BACL|nr:hypothetical protein SD71_21485 [Cohnella kolymensis]
MGVLTARKELKFDTPVFFQDLAIAAAALGAQLFLFSPDDVELSDGSIRGFIPDPITLTYQEDTFTNPNLILDRYLPYRKSFDELQKYQEIRQNPAFRIVNSCLPDKWNVYQILKAKPTVVKNLPTTRLYSSKTLRQMIKRYETVYMKPLHETGGRGIIKITHKRKGYSLYARDLHRVQSYSRVTSLEELLARIQKITLGHAYLVQQGLDLSLVENRVTDMRLLLQKTENGEWSVTGYGMRVGAKNSPTSNLHGGGIGKPVQLLYSRFGKKRSKRIRQRFLKLAYRVGRTIEKHCGQMVEMGLDIGIDTRGKVWLIEVNGMPGRQIFKQMDRMNLYRKAVSSPLRYILGLLSIKSSEKKAQT